MFKKPFYAAAAGLAAAVFMVSAHAQEITGAGATFPAPLYSKWAADYQKATNVRMNYQSIGSSGGVRQITARTVDFGASDAPMSAADLEKNGMIQFPAAIGGVVPTFNLPGIQPGQVKLTGAVLADIFLTRITKWNDPAIARLNPGVNLPDLNISVIRRADGSGTTFVFTDYLSKVSEAWRTGPGTGNTVNWPGNSIGGKGNEGVAAFIQRTPGSIGYVEYSYAKQTRMPFAAMINAAGNTVLPDDKTFAAAAAGAEWAKTPGFGVNLNNINAKDAWPITSATFILMYRTQEKPAQGTEVVKFFDWAFANGDKAAIDLDYVPIPDAVVKLVQAQWSANLKDPQGRPLPLK
jgi:phosphate transport system substrate-binding protein